MTVGYSSWEVAAILAAVKGEGDREVLLAEARSRASKSDVLKKYSMRLKQLVSSGRLQCEVNQFGAREFNREEVEAFALIYPSLKPGARITPRTSETAVPKSGGVKSAADARKKMNREMKARGRRYYQKKKAAGE